MSPSAETPETSPVDLTVIGSGPGGYVAAIRASQLGMKVVLVEKDPRPGGCCLHRGCIPTKALLYSAEILHLLENREKFGIRAENIGLDIAGVNKKKTRVVQKLARGIEGLLRKNRIETVHGLGRISGCGRVAVAQSDGKTREIATRNILIATGSIPAALPVAPFDCEKIISSDHILELDRIPSSITILGAGAVGAEFASIYASFGSRVTIVEILPQILPLEDPEVAQVLEKSFRARKIQVRTGSKLEGAGVDGASGRVVSRIRDGDGKLEELESELLLVAVGRTPYTEGLGLETVGIEVDASGRIPVNEWLQTSQPGIYAIGDVIDTPQLAHVASAEGILAAEHMAGRERPPVNYRANPFCTYCFPEVASVGLTEPAARQQGHDVRVGKFPFAALGKASILGETEGFVKIVADGKYDEVLGVHIVGPHATDLIAEACAAIQLETTVEELAHTIHPHPTLTESMLEAAHAVYGQGIHF